VINVAHLMYADDIVIYIEGQSIQEMAEKLRVDVRDMIPIHIRYGTYTCIHEIICDDDDE